jgi:hypothetical protein
MEIQRDEKILEIQKEIRKFENISKNNILQNKFFITNNDDDGKRNNKRAKAKKENWKTRKWFFFKENFKEFRLEKRNYVSKRFANLNEKENNLKNKKTLFFLETFLNKKVKKKNKEKKKKYYQQHMEAVHNSEKI